MGDIRRELLIARNTTHGLSRKDGKRTRLYGIWVRMRQRCRDKKSSDYSLYGGRGVAVCEEWNDYATFYEWAIDNGYAENLSIDRINPNGNYEPSNCRWIPLAAQARNKSNNHYITFQGETRTLAEWGVILGMETSLLRYRLKNWGVERAFSAPIRGRNATV